MPYNERFYTKIKFALVVLFLIVLALIAAVTVAPKQAGAIIGGGVGAHNHSSGASGGGTLALSGTLSSTKACASGYTRVGPNFCGSTSAYSTPGLVRDACTALTLPAGDAKALLISASVLLVSNNTVSVKFAQVDAFNDSGCVTMLDRVQWRSVEAVANPGAVYLGGGNVNMIVRGSTPYIRFSDDTTNVHLGFYAIIGYFD